MRRWWGVALLLLLLPACSPDASPSPGPSPDEVELGIIQLIPEEGSDQALLRVGNEGEQALEVRRLGLDWPGYGAAFLVDNDATVPAGQTLDLRMTLPDPVCDPPGRVAAVGVLETTAGRVAAPLKDTSQDYLRRLWRVQCDDRLVAQAVDVTVSRAWEQRGPDRDAVAVGTLQLTPRGEGHRVEVVRTAGSVLYDVDVDPVVLEPGRPDVETTLRLLPGNRCDEHARGQATAPFDFELVLRVDGRRVTVPLPVPTQAADAAQTVLDRVCGAVTTADTPADARSGGSSG